MHLLALPLHAQHSLLTSTIVYLRNFFLHHFISKDQKPSSSRVSCMFPFFRLLPSLPFSYFLNTTFFFSFLSVSKVPPPGKG